jgi:hypothetical protein
VFSWGLMIVSLVLRAFTPAREDKMNPQLNALVSGSFEKLQFIHGISRFSTYSRRI